MVLMIGGIAVIGVVTATLASWIVSRVADESADEQAATRRQVALLQEQIERLEQKVDALASPSPADHDSIPVPHPDTDADHDRNPDQDPGNHA
ncbi:LapA family protein [Actinomyces provencensis]|uniref:LapA family protein n=1 Tax=Actinomyces provencensis TaxID=1720198 RepID=UPI0011783D31|nr:LapA family protein [Actinomyces provencensis]